MGSVRRQGRRHATGPSRLSSESSRTARDPTARRSRPAAGRRPRRSRSGTGRARRGPHGPPHLDSADDQHARAIVERREGLRAHTVGVASRRPRTRGVGHYRDRDLRPDQHARRPPRASRPPGRSAGIPLVEVLIPPACSNEVYEATNRQAFASEPLAGIDTVAFGDLFLEDVRAYREERLAAARQARTLPALGARHQPNSPTSSSPRLRGDARLRRPCVSSTRRSPAAASTKGCSPTSRPPSTPAARTASSTPSSTPGRSSHRRSSAHAATSSTATASSSAT